MTPNRRGAAWHVTLVWALLVCATLLVGWLAEGHGVHPKTAVTVTFGVAALKARMVLRHYMELRHAPSPWPVIFEVWTFGSAGGILAAYWWCAG